MRNYLRKKNFFEMALEREVVEKVEFLELRKLSFDFKSQLKKRRQNAIKLSKLSKLIFF